MAGDHKCPVCNSTFTRPQHVARHMRSHTGDRPYKCTTCGDQFARSDLLSRHVNKCHASEQPPTTKARRRGTAAGARALSSKQACDQCVTNSLPCDGAKPCSKCRGKDRCTYVQFHRQTAPSGPGHPMPPPTHSDILARAPISIQGAPDDFLLAPIVPQAATTMDIASMYAHPHYIPPSSDIYHDYPHLPSLANAQSNSLNALIQRDALDNQDAIARYHAHSDLFARAGVIQNAALSLAQPAPTADNTTSLPALYAAAQDPQYDRYTMSQPPSSHQSWEATPSYHQSKSVMDAPSYAPHSHPPSSVSSAGSSHPPSVGPPPSIEAGGPPSQPQYPHAPLPSLYQEQQQQQQVPRHHPYHHHSRSDDLSSSEAGDLASDAGSTGTGPSHSIPSSANSSAIHLPLPGVNSLRSKGPTSAKDDFEDRYPNVPSQDGNEHETESGFSSVFGMMSLDDPNVIAGISNDGQPFFSSLPGFPNNNSSSPAPLSLVTPTQDLLTQLKSAGGREGIDSKEMRDFWKMYLRTPLTGTNASGNGVMFPLQTPTGPGVPLGHNNSAQGSGAGAGRPSPSRRHSRVASLPSIKTPPLFAEDRGQFAQRPSTGDHSDQEAGVAGGYNSNVRTTLHDSEDLKSYEQAVLARKPSMHLNLVPKRKGSHTSSRTQNPPIGKSKSTSPVVPHAFSSGPKTTSPVAPHAFLSGPASFPLSSGSSNIAELLNRPSSSSSTDTSSSISHPSNTANTTASSSLAHAFGGQQPPRSEGQPTRSPPPDTHGAYTTDSCRPSFKRIASQTLAPDNAKRASLGPAGWDVNRYDEEDEEEEDACLNTSPRISGTALYETTSQPSLAVPAQS